MVVSDHLGILSVLTTRIFTFNLVLGRGPGKIECLGMLVRGQIGMLVESVY